MRKPTYALEPDPRGGWRVVEIRTGLPASHRNHVMTRMGLDEADAMQDLLTMIRRRPNPGTLSRRRSRVREAAE